MRQETLAITTPLSPAPIALTTFSLETQYSLLLLGRMLTGLGVGLASLLSPLYTSELASGNRDSLLLYFQAMLSAGVGCAYVVAWSALRGAEDEPADLNRYSLGCAVACLPALLCCWAPAARPRLGDGAGEEDKVRETLRRLGWTEELAIEREIERVRAVRQRPTVSLLGVLGQGLY